MKIAVVGDVHGNVAALRAVLARARALGVTRLFVLGDLVGYYPYAGEVLAELSAWRIDVVQGNHERMLAAARASPAEATRVRAKYGRAIDVALATLPPADLDWLGALPHEQTVEVDGRTFLLAHGSPGAPDEYVYPDVAPEAFDRLAAGGADVVLIGHSHYQFVRAHGRTLVVNPGSVGQARDVGALACWAVIDTANLVVQPMRTAYDVGPLYDAVRRSDPEAPYLGSILVRNAGRAPASDPALVGTLLVTGCGGDIGLGVARIARAEHLARRIIGVDAGAQHAGPAVLDACWTVERASAPSYRDTLARLVREEKVDVIVPTSEAELEVLAHHGELESFAGVPVVSANEGAVMVGLDKWKTVEMLRDAGLPWPWTRIVGDAPPDAVPCILKSRRGQGSKNLVRLEDPSLVPALAARRAGDLWQELLLPDDEELTCGVYRGADGTTRTLAFRRKLVGGLTGSGEVVDDDAVRSLLERIADVLALRGSINAQLRRTSRGPVVFEINPRFSSTMVFRHLLGFRDLEWSIRERLGLAIDPYVAPPVGTRIFRGAREYVLAPNEDER